MINHDHISILLSVTSFCTQISQVVMSTVLFIK
uniref:Uncharacterized protein n=1 Tax=Arundo donax TaxID=35708 RepID=A0A0A9FEF0_ARUDO